MRRRVTHAWAHATRNVSRSMIIITIINYCNHYQSVDDDERSNDGTKNADATAYFFLCECKTKPNAKRKKTYYLLFKHYLTKKRHNYIRNNILYIHIFFGHYERVRSENEPRLLLARVGDVFLFHEATIFL